MWTKYTIELTEKNADKISPDEFEDYTKMLEEELVQLTLGYLKHFQFRIVENEGQVDEKILI